MGVRPPRGDDEEPSTVAFGIAAVDDHLDGVDVSYPISASELDAQIGHVEVPYDALGHTVALGSVIRECERDAFEDEQDLLNALHPVFERHRQRGVTMMERVRRFLPL